MCGQGRREQNRDRAQPCKAGESMRQPTTKGPQEARGRDALTAFILELRPLLVPPTGREKKPRRRRVAMGDLECNCKNRKTCCPVALPAEAGCQADGLAERAPGDGPALPTRSELQVGSRAAPDCRHSKRCRTSCGDFRLASHFSSKRMKSLVFRANGWEASGRHRGKPGSLEKPSLCI